MTAHKTRAKTASGSRIARKGAGPKMVRIMGAFPEADWKCLQHVARLKKLPVAQVLRDAVWAYSLPCRADVK